MAHMTPMTGPMGAPNDATVGDRILVNGRPVVRQDILLGRRGAPTS
jgi:hypothetical protein